MAQEKIYKNIDINDISLYPFKVYKQNEISSSINFDETTCYELNRAIYPIITEYPGNCITISASLASNEPKNWNNKEQKLYYYHLKNLYNSLIPSKNFINTLYYSSSILSIPRSVFGEGIKRNSFQITSSDGRTFHDDGYGNIIDSNLSSTILSDSSSFIYVTANNTMNDESVYYKLHKNLNEEIIQTNVIKTDGIITIGDSSQICGKALGFSVNSNIILNNTENEQFFNIDSDYAISLWFKPHDTQSYDSAILTTKRNTGKTYIYNSDNETKELSITNLPTDVYPFEISFISSSYVQVKGSDGLNSFQVTSSTISSLDSWHHILYQKSGSTVQLYLDNNLSESNYNLTLNQNNKALLEIGKNYTGSIEEYMVFNQLLNMSEISYLSDNNYTSGSFKQEKEIGNIFYDLGIVTFNGINPSYQIILFKTVTGIEKNSFTFKFKSTQTLYENEIICKVRQDEFNHTLNPTARKNNNPNSSILKDFATSSDFTPYITEIGLYNDNNELLVISKLAHPIPKIKNIDTNFLIRFDI